MQVFRHLDDVTKKRTEDAENWAKGNVGNHILFGFIPFIDYVSNLGFPADAQRERDEVKARMEGAEKKLESTLADLAKAQKDLSDHKNDKGKAETGRDTAATKVKDTAAKFRLS